MPLPRAGCGRPTGTADHGLLNLLIGRKVLAVGETSPFHSLARKKAKEKRTLVKWPGFVNNAALAWMW
jgi:hypothetical protein